MGGRALQERAQLVARRHGDQPPELGRVGRALGLALPDDGGNEGAGVAVPLALARDQGLGQQIGLVGVIDIQERIPLRRAGVEGIEDHVAAAGVVEPGQVAAVRVGEYGPVATLKRLVRQLADRRRLARR